MEIKGPSAEVLENKRFLCDFVLVFLAGCWFCHRIDARNGMGQKEVGWPGKVIQ